MHFKWYSQYYAFIMINAFVLVLMELICQWRRYILVKQRYHFYYNWVVTEKKVHIFIRCMEGISFETCN